jgi:nitrilase
VKSISPPDSPSREIPRESFVPDSTDKPFLVASVQAAPVFLDREATVEKACRLIAEAGQKGARLAVFPEGFIPTYPFWIWYVPAGETRLLRELYSRFLENSMTIPGESVDRLCSAAGEARVNVAIGVNEVDAEGSRSTVYNTILYIDDGGLILGKHRKLIPTAGERLVHGQGDGSTLGVHQLSIGRIGGLICWENYMPLARYAMYAWGTQIYVAPTWDHGEPWTSTLRHIAKEGRVYVIGCCSALRLDDIPDDYAFKEKHLPGEGEWLNPGGSAIANPDGRLIAGPLREEEAILYGEVDPIQISGPRWQLDVSGHYGRPDIFDLTVRREHRPPIRESEIADSEPAGPEEEADDN